MFKDDISICPQRIQLRCLELKTESERLHYGRFAVSPFEKGQANTIGIAMRRALPQEIEGTSITRAKFRGIVHEYSTITGLQETVYDVSVNLKEIVLKSDSNDIWEAFSSITGPKEVTAGDTLLPPRVKVIDKSQYIATITQPISSTIELGIEKGRGYRIENLSKSQDGQFPIDAVFMPVRNVNYSIHLFRNGNVMQEISFIEIWTNGSLTPHEALLEASNKIVDLLTPFSQMQTRYGNTILLENGKQSLDSTKAVSLRLHLGNATKQNEKIPKNIFIDQLELPARAFNCLKRAKIYTIADLLTYSREDLSEIRNFGQRSLDQVVKELWNRFNIELPSERVSNT
uniref:DNA-directed RNA polymerase subunit alpha n=1 Tax=Antrophyum semicostatum TaxID=1604141 RepID=A0A3G5CTV2_9MONI|nr:RNA polymerase alpha subunit [Antrophyum semicostatum]AYW16278.1 RNA polymerase alpha subunit [Antrophyum semicostatum]